LAESSTRQLASDRSLALLTNIPAPYYVSAWNHLGRLTGGRLAVRFIARGERRRTWKTPVDGMEFAWRFLSRATDPSDFLRSLSASVAMLGFLMDFRPRAVICGGYSSPVAWITFAWCAITRRRFVLWMESNARDHRRPGKLRHWMKRFIVSRADAIAALGKAASEYARQLGAREDRIFIAPFGGDSDFFARQASGVDGDREKWLKGLPPRLVLYSGRLVREKGVFVLLESFRLIAAEFLDVGLLIVGHGPERQAMEDCCRRLGLELVYFAGAQEYKRMPYFYALADVLVLPTFSDPYGYVVAEAFACSVPAIVSRVAGACDDLIVEGETGFTVEPGDPEDLAAKMRRLLQDEPLRAAMGRNCRELIRRYSAEACAQGLFLAAQARRGEVMWPRPQGLG
jgi:glycosyltransferase involved in cell wall biosynthesis